MPAYLDTGLNLIDVEDCAKGMCSPPGAEGWRSTSSAAKHDFKGYSVC
jgi:hypothetical protein